MDTPAHLRYSKEHEWAKADGDVVTIGITDFAQNQLGDVVYVELPKVGAQLKQMVPFGVVESVKTASDLFSPVSGEVVEVNSVLADQPELVNSSPYEGAWMIKVRMANSAELEQLLGPSDYEKLTAEEGH